MFAGHIETQQVLTPNGLIPIKDLKVGDLVISYNFNAKKPEDLFINTPIIKTQKNYADALYEIYIEDNRCISASPQQKFLVATQKDKDQESLTFRIEVIEAQYLTHSHMLLDSNLLTIPITQTHKKELYKVERRVKKYFWKSIKHVKRKTIFTRIDLYSIELQEPHNYLIPVFSQGIDCKDDKNIPLILMHNGLPALAAGISLAFGSTPASLSFAEASIAAGGVSLLAGPAGWAIGAAALGSYALYTLFDKGHKEQLFLEMSTDDTSDDSSKNQEPSEKNKDPKGNKNPPPPPPLGKKDRDKDPKYKNEQKSKEYPKDFKTNLTNDGKAIFKSEREARNLARNKIGHNPVDIGNNKLRSQDGKWQYRAKPKDITGEHAGGKHIHLEELNPDTGEVINNWHLFWEKND